MTGVVGGADFSLLATLFLTLAAAAAALGDVCTLDTVSFFATVVESLGLSFALCFLSFTVSFAAGKGAAGFSKKIIFIRDFDKVN